MCWFFVIIIPEKDYSKDIDNIKELRALYKKYNLEAPKSIEVLEDIDCLCVVDLKDLGDDDLSLHLTKYIGQRTFTKIEDDKLEMKWETTKEEERKVYEKSFFNEKCIFHKIILEEVFKSDNSLILDFW